ncbi:MAG: hypothetical protein ACFFDT_08130 [Candidatus Hodarchaeota archaeon]
MAKAIPSYEDPEDMDSVPTKSGNLGDEIAHKENDYRSPDGKSLNINPKLDNKKTKQQGFDDNNSVQFSCRI